MFAVSAAFTEALRESHNVVLRLDAYRGGVLLASDLPIAGGEVVCDATSQVRRELRVTVADPALAPGVDTAAILSPYGTDLAPYRGIRFPDGTVEWVPLGLFRVDKVHADLQAGVIGVTGPDRSKRVADDRFLLPAQSVTTNTVPAEIARLIHATLPAVTVADSTGSTTLAQLVTWEQDRWAAVEQLADAIGAEAFFDVAGNVVIRNPPVPAAATIGWWLDVGAHGVLIGGEQDTTRERTYNGVVVSGEQTDGTAPVAATVTDDDPASATYWSGPYGHVPMFYSSPLITTTAQAMAAAQTILNRTRGLVRQINLTAVPNPALEAGDVIGVLFPDGTAERHVVDSVTIPLDATTAMTVATRSGTPEQSGP